jgi:hypothetical protein
LGATICDATDLFSNTIACAKPATLCGSMGYDGPPIFDSTTAL